MNRVTITLTIDLPDGVVPDVAYATLEPAQEPPHVAEEFAPMAAYDADLRVSGQVQRDPAPLCQHGIPMKRYPAGVSKSTGKSYNASWRPSDANCTTKAIWDKDPVAA
jgi:hypothetical protein